MINDRPQLSSETSSAIRATKATAERGPFGTRASASMILSTGGEVATT